jgi:gp16 family phage-associated protein
MQPRTATEARAELQAKGISITQWALAHQFSPNLVFEVLGGRKKCVRGQAHEIAVKLGLKVGEIVNPKDIDHSVQAAVSHRRLKAAA